MKRSEIQAPQVIEVIAPVSTQEAVFNRKVEEKNGNFYVLCDRLLLEDHTKIFYAQLALEAKLEGLWEPHLRETYQERRYQKKSFLQKGITNTTKTA